MSGKILAKGWIVKKKVKHKRFAFYSDRHFRLDDDSDMMRVRVVKDE